MKVLLSLKVDEEVKKEAQELAEELGLTLSAVMNASLAQFVRDKQLILDARPTMTPYLEEKLREAEEDYKAGRNHESFESVEEAIAFLRGRRSNKS